MLVRQLASFYDRSFLQYAKKDLPPVRFESLFHSDMAKRSIADVVENAQKLRHTLLIRLARRIVDIHRLPYAAVTQEPMQKLHDLFVHTFHAFARTPEVRTELEEDRFSALLDSLLSKTKAVLPLMLESHGILAAQLPQHAVNAFMNTMLVSRISRRILASHHLALRRHVLGEGDGTTFGTIQPDCDLPLLVEHAYRTATAAVTPAPELKLVASPRAGPLCYVPSHLHLMLRELFHWSASSVAKRHALLGSGPDAIPPIEVTVYESSDSTTIKIADQGGGIPDERVPTVFDYQPPGADNPLPLGLPLARTYAGYFGGTCRVQSLPEYGCEVFLTIRHLDASCLGVLNSDTYTEDPRGDS